MNSLKSNNKSDKHKAVSTIDGITLNQRRELVFSELKRKNKIRTIFKDCDVSEIKEIFERFKAVYEERLEEEALKKKKDEELKKEAQSILNEMEEKGINVELLRELQMKQNPSSVPAAKVKYIKDGATWSGQGRRPLAFKGLSDFELEKYRKTTSND
jgi:DNA-binding protein H-NS